MNTVVMLTSGSGSTLAEAKPSKRAAAGSRNRMVLLMNSALSSWSFLYFTASSSSSSRKERSGDKGKRREAMNSRMSHGCKIINHKLSNSFV